MTLAPLATAALPWRGLRLGPLRFSPYGLCAAAGLLSAMGVARQCALPAGLDPERVWDAGLFAIFICFAASRLLLVMQNLHAFFGEPMALLGQPSLTFGGLLLAAVATVAYLRHKALPFLATLDTFALPGAVLAASLELGHWLEGTEEGMPTRLPWGVRLPGAPATLRVHPVALYGVLLAVGLAGLLWRSLRHAAPPGGTAALGLLGGGAAAFGLDMLSAPPLLGATSWLEPGQWVALAALAAGALGLSRPLWLGPSNRPAGASEPKAQEPSFAPGVR